MIIYVLGYICKDITVLLNYIIRLRRCNICVFFIQNKSRVFFDISNRLTRAKHPNY